MKKAVLVFLFALLTFGMLLNSAVVLADENNSNSSNSGISCKDSDGGKNIYKKGVVTGYKVRLGQEIVTREFVMTFEDSCALPSGQDSSSLTEYYCKDGIIESESVKCNCVWGDNGACVPNNITTNKFENDACKEISGETFRSIKQYERGLGSYGRVLGYWSISFKNGQFSWIYSDIVEEGSYICNGKSITGTSSSGRKLIGEYDVNEDILIWEGIEYSEMNDNDEIEDNDQSELRTRTTSKEVITRDNCTIKIEREIKLEDGKRVEIVKRKMVCADGREVEVKIRVENRTQDGILRERIKYELEGKEFDVDTGEGINLEEDTNGTEYRIRARLRNGNLIDIKVMPDRAHEIALERLKALNFTIELREVKTRGNISKIVYHAKAYKDGRFIGIFKMKVKVETEIDPETGEVITTSKPWWAFFVAGEDSNQSGEVEEENETEAESNMPVPGNETVNDTEVHDAEDDNSNNNTENLISGSGKIEFVNLEGGCWRITTSEGNYEAINLNESYRQDGLEIEFEGRITVDSASICQVGTLIEISDIKIKGSS